MKIIQGKHANGRVYTWKVRGEKTGEPGDYAIVESLNSYALVEIVATGETTEKYVNSLVNGMSVSKEVILIIPRGAMEKLAKDKDSRVVYVPVVRISKE